MSPSKCSMDGESYVLVPSSNLVLIELEENHLFFSGPIYIYFYETKQNQEVFVGSPEKNVVSVSSLPLHKLHAKSYGL